MSADIEGVELGRMLDDFISLPPPFIVSAPFAWICCELRLFVAMQMHPSNGKRYTLIIMSCGLRSELKNDKLCV